MADLPQSIALVYDRVVKWGGAEQVLLSLHELFPQAPLYTAVYNSQTAPWAQVFPQVIPSFLQHFPLARSHHELYPWLTPLAFESLNFNQYSAIISITSADAKGIISRPATFHLCYCLTPTRYLWSHSAHYQKQIAQFFTVPIFNYLKDWDHIAAQRPDAFIAISRTVQERIQKYYHRDSQIVYPPVSSTPFPPSLSNSSDRYFLWVGRLVSYKRPDLVIRLFNDLKLPLRIVGVGNQMPYLRQLAGPHISFTGFVSPSELSTLYSQAQALISVHEEDFGLVYAEAQAAGLPVIALNRGAVSEIITHGQTGYVVSTYAELKQAIVSFRKTAFNTHSLLDNSQRFSKTRFLQEFAKVFTTAWEKHQRLYHLK